MTSPSYDSIAPERLADIAEIVLDAARDVQDYTGAPTPPYPASLMGSPLQPDILSQFTLYEVEQASEFLVRLGLIEPRKR